MLTEMGEVGNSSSLVVEAVESAVMGRCNVAYVWLSFPCADIFDGSPCTGCVTIGTGGGTLGIGRGVGMSNGLVGVDGVPESFWETL